MERYLAVFVTYIVNYMKGYFEIKLMCVGQKAVVYSLLCFDSRPCMWAL